jgi:hypothetical protein
MKNTIRGAAFVLVLLAACVPGRASAQAAQDVRFVSVSTFEIPRDTTQRRLLMTMIDSVMVPYARMDPNVLSYRVMMHRWGANSNVILIMSEFPSWAAIEAECAQCDAWVASKTPAVGTPARAGWDAMQMAFQRAYSGHSDEIYTVPVRRSK